MASNQAQHTLRNVLDRQGRPDRPASKLSLTVIKKSKSGFLKIHFSLHRRVQRKQSLRAHLKRQPVVRIMHEVVHRKPKPAIVGKRSYWSDMISSTPRGLEHGRRSTGIRRPLALAANGSETHSHRLAQPLLCIGMAVDSSPTDMGMFGFLPRTASSVLDHAPNKLQRGG